MTTVGVVGLGIMGGAFAGHLAAAGIRTLGYDPIEAQGAALEQRGGIQRASVDELAEEVDLLITSLPSVAALEQTTESLVRAGRSGFVAIETSTLPLAAKEKARAKLAEVGVGLLDAPVSGTGAQAKAKDICVLASGDRADFDSVRDLLALFSRSVRYVGEFGTGSKVKYIANLLVAIHTLAAAEALALGEKAGLDPAALLDVLTDGAGTSRMLEVRGPSMVQNTFSTPMIKVDVFQKDLDIIAAFARESGCPAPLLNASIPFFTAAGAEGLGGYDTAAVLTVLRRMAGLSAR